MRPCKQLTCGMLQDALNEIARQRARDLLKPLRVHFIGEDGIDAGGVKKEFFQLLVTELLCPDYGMLIFQPVGSPCSCMHACTSACLIHPCNGRHATCCPSSACVPTMQSNAPGRQELEQYLSSQQFDAEAVRYRSRTAFRSLLHGCMNKCAHPARAHGGLILVLCTSGVQDVLVQPSNAGA